MPIGLRKAIAAAGINYVVYQSATDSTASRLRRDEQVFYVGKRRQVPISLMQRKDTKSNEFAIGLRQTARRSGLRGPIGGATSRLSRNREPPLCKRRCSPPKDPAKRPHRLTLDRESAFAPCAPNWRTSDRLEGRALIVEGETAWRAHFSRHRQPSANLSKSSSFEGSITSK